MRRSTRRLRYRRRIELVRYAYDRGVRYFDTAGNYLESQAILGEAIKDRRHQEAEKRVTDFLSRRAGPTALP